MHKEVSSFISQAFLQATSPGTRKDFLLSLEGFIPLEPNIVTPALRAAVSEIVFAPAQQDDGLRVAAAKTLEQMAKHTPAKDFAAANIEAAIEAVLSPDDEPEVKLSLNKALYTLGRDNGSFSKILDSLLARFRKGGENPDSFPLAASCLVSDLAKNNRKAFISGFYPRLFSSNLPKRPILHHEAVMFGRILDLSRDVSAAESYLKKTNEDLAQELQKPLSKQDNYRIEAYYSLMSSALPLIAPTNPDLVDQGFENLSKTLSNKNRVGFGVIKTLAAMTKISPKRTLELVKTSGLDVPQISSWIPNILTEIAKTEESLTPRVLELMLGLVQKAPQPVYSSLVTLALKSPKYAAAYRKIAGAAEPDSLSERFLQGLAETAIDLAQEGPNLPDPNKQLQAIGRTLETLTICRHDRG